MRKIAVTLALVGLCVSQPSLAASVKGLVVYKRSDCGNHFIVQTPLGYTILEWFGGVDVDEGDTLVGPIESYGMPDVYDINKDSSVKVWVENYWLSRSSLAEDYFNKYCHK